MTGPGRRALVLGGARAGKSAHAETLLAGEPAVDYVATAVPDPADAEWAERIARHRERRPSTWHTIETTDLAGVLAGEGSAVLLDSVTAWLTTVMADVGLGCGVPEADERLALEIDRTVGAWAAAQRRVVAVSDEVGSGVVARPGPERLFRDALGLLNQRLAASADEVWLLTAGIPLRLR